MQQYQQKDLESTCNSTKKTIYRILVTVPTKIVRELDQQNELENVCNSTNKKS